MSRKVDEDMTVIREELMVTINKINIPRSAILVILKMNSVLSFHLAFHFFKNYNFVMKKINLKDSMQNPDPE